MGTDPLSNVEFIAEKERRRKAGLLLQGDTYRHRDKIKQAGGIWDKLDKGWLMPDLAAMQAVGAVLTDHKFQIPKPMESPVS